MRVDQTGEQDLLAEIQDVASVTGFYLFERADGRYLISGDRNRAILNRLAHHRHDHA
jgi:hypothetical protein